jgi:serine/threonine protein kinase
VAGGHHKEGRVQLARNGQVQCVLKLEDKKESALLQKKVMNVARTADDLHVVSLISFHPPNEHDARYCLELEVLQGDLPARIQLQGEELFKRQAMKQCARDIVDAVAHIHGIKEKSQGFPDGIVHMDIKPMNIMLSGKGTFKLIDFDNSRGSEMNVCIPEPPGVTTTYTSPEMYQADRAGFHGAPILANKAHDMFCVGLVLWYIYSDGHKPAFETDSDAERAFLGTADPVVDVGLFHSGK